MKVVYTGIQRALPQKLQAKLDAKFAKLGKLLDGRGEREARVIVTQERHLYRAEVTLPFYDHDLVSVSSNTDVFTALMETLERLEKQALKQRAKWRDKGRHKESARSIAEQPPSAPAKSTRATPRTTKPEKNSAKPDGSPSKRVFKVNHRGQR